jgi:hypothetical protein
MHPEKKKLSAELEELGASHLKKVLEENMIPLSDTTLENKMIQGVYKHFEEAKKVATVIDLRTGMRSTRGSFSLIIRMVAGIAAILIMGLLGYRLLFPGFSTTSDCEDKNLLTCLKQQTSDEEIYNYLMQEYSGTEDVYLFEKIHSTPSDQIPVELQ